MKIGSLWDDKYEILGIYQHAESDCYWIVFDMNGTLVEENISEWYQNYMEAMIPF